MRLRVEGLRRAFPDVRFSVDDLVAETWRVAVRYQWQGTQSGAFMGIPSPGRRVLVMGRDFYRLAGIRIVEHWHSVDELGLVP